MPVTRLPYRLATKRAAREAASNVENMLLSREAELVQKFLGRSPPADMKFVDWSKIIYRYSV